ncbi:MAG: D-alanyl-D-alanine carboxypeptidase [Clostridia bacterium]|nr:D-alanyl-D-alanine carboxypeptidase [Clostridia bacterium]
MFRKNTNLYIAIFLITALVFSLITVYAAGEPKKKSISAKAAVLYQPDTDSFIFTKNENTRLPMASTTKIMTALVALENSDLNDYVQIDSSAVGIEGSSAYLKEGEVLTMEELIYALLLRSANDAAAAIACHISGDTESFADMMNERAEALGLKNTYFKNPHGLDDEGHYTTAHDLALIAAEALKNDSFKKISSTYKKSFATEDMTRLYVNHNKLLNMYDGAIGIKTGYTKKSGRCLVGAAERDGLTFITVTLDAPDDWRDHMALFDLGFETLERIEFATEGEYEYSLPLLDGEANNITVTNTEGASVITRRGDHEINKYIKLSKFATAPIKKGEIFGEIVFTLDGEKASSVKLVATDNINKKEDKGFFKKLFEKLGL